MHSLVVKGLVDSREYKKVPNKKETQQHTDIHNSNNKTESQ